MLNPLYLPVDENPIGPVFIMVPDFVANVPSPWMDAYALFVCAWPCGNRCSLLPLSPC